MLYLFRKKEVTKVPQVDKEPKVSIDKLKEYYNKADKSLKEGKENQAEFFIRKVMKERPTDADLLHKLVELIPEMGYDGYDEDSIYCFEKLIELNPNDLDLWNSYIHVLKEYIGEDCETIVEIINRALLRFTKNEQMLEMKCNLLIEDGADGLEILKTLKIWKNINPTNKTIWDLKEAAIDIIMGSEDEDNPEVLDLIEKI